MKGLIIGTIVAASMFFVMSPDNALAQEVQSAADFEQRYDLLVSKLGPAGVGIETHLDRWEAAYPEDPAMWLGKFLYYYTKSNVPVVEVKPGSRFMGEKPVLTLKDSTGAPINYFQDMKFDDELFGKSIKYIDKAVNAFPDRLDYRLYKLSSLVNYEKESPEMALEMISSMIDFNYTQKPEWKVKDEKLEPDAFSAEMQTYAFTFFKYATPSGYEAFKSVSGKMLKYEPSNVLFLNNMGSYYLVSAKDNKTALKYYNKVLKIKPDDITAIKNCIILARNSGNVKLEKKYLPMMLKYGETETDRMSAEARLKFLDKK